MAYNPEKYREKRERVLGVRRRGLSFGTVAALVSVLIILGLGVVVVPRSVAYLATRNLDDFIYKLEQVEAWNAGHGERLEALPGVRQVVHDQHGGRIVVTVDRTESEGADLAAFFGREGLKVTLLNEVNHRHRQHALEKEANQ